MADAAVGFLLENLDLLKLNYGDSIRGLRNEVQDLYKDLVELKSITKNYETLLTPQGEDEMVKENEILRVLMKQIRKLANRAEDAVETFLVEARQCDDSLVEKRRSTAELIQSIREELGGMMDMKDGKISQSANDKGTMALADSALRSYVVNLKGMLSDAACWIHGLRDEAQSLYEDLVRFKSFTEKYEMLHLENEILKTWAKRVTELVYKAEDTFDEFISEARKHDDDYAEMCGRAAEEIEFIREKLRGIIVVNREMIKAVEDEVTFSGSATGQDRKEPAVKEENAMGIDEEANTVISRLIGGSEELDVNFIIGMPGVGKTTLARKVFNDSRIKGAFGICAFTYVSAEHNPQKVLLDILSSFIQITEDMHKMTEERLAELLHSRLVGRRYLIVMDNVRAKEAWNHLKVAFPANQYGRVLTTTRKANVAFFANPKSYPCNLRLLTLEESRELLRRKLFGKKSFSLELEQFELSIAQNCGGLPLALVAITEILVNKRNRIEWWKKAQENVNLYVTLYLEKILGFNQLPDHLKLCFLYLGVFPKDSEIPVWKLIRLWIAEGLIQQVDPGLSLEDIAEKYLENLVIRNLVVVRKRRSNGRIKTCYIHGTLHEFCKHAAGKENLLQEIKGGSFLYSSLLQDKQRRLFVDSSLLDYISSGPSGSHVRTFLSFAKEEKVLPDFFEAFKLLRVLDIKSSKFAEFPNQVCKLILLKYLAITGDFKILPEAISGLQNMQTLIIETSSDMFEIKADIWKMLQLRHLHTNKPTDFLGHRSKALDGKEVSINLQTLSRISPESCTRVDFARLPYLKKLGVCGKLALILQNGESEFFENLHKLRSLQNLELMNDNSSSKLPGLPEVHKFLQKVTKLTLCKTSLDWKHMSTLAKLENLEVLKLKDNAFEGKFWQTEDGGFHSLKVLNIGKTNLEIWKASAHHFPGLGYLVLRDCSELKAIPSGLADISSLQKIDLYGANNPSVVSSARKIQLLKLQNQAQQGTNISWFKLKIYNQD